MSQPNVYKTVSVTASASLQNLLTALQAVDISVLASYREVNLQADPGNTTNNVLIGDDQTTAARCGVALTAGSSRTYRQSGSGMTGIPIANMFFLASAGSPRLNVELIM